MSLKDLIPQLDEGTTITIQQRSKSGNNEIKDNQIANHIVNLNINVDAGNIDFLKELLWGATSIESTQEFKANILPIEKLISDGKTKIAIDKFKELLDSEDFNKYSIDEKFLVYNGIFNCLINNQADSSEIRKWSEKIEALGDVKEIHRYYYLKAIWKYNNKDYKIAKKFIDQAIKAKPEYINALSCDYLIKLSNLEITFEEAKDGLGALLKKPDLKATEIATIYGFLGDVAFNSRKYDMAKDYYKESNDYSQSLSKEIGYAICIYHTSIKELKPDNRVDFQNIEFSILNKSKILLEEIYSVNEKESLDAVAKMAFPYLFNIYSLTGEFDKTIAIFEKCKQSIDYKNKDVVRLIVQAQVINKEYDEQLFVYLDEYDSIKYKSIYYERCEEFEKAYDLILPAVEGKNSEDKALQLTLLNCLQELDRFEDYMFYFKKFMKKEVNEVHWLNYIEYQDKKGEKELVVSELSKLKNILSNAFVIHRYLHLLIKYDLNDELDDFFDNVDRGNYPIIDTNKSYLIYQKMIYFLKKGSHEKYYSLYEKLNIDELTPVDRWVLTVNYYTCKGDLSKCGESYFELYKVGSNQNDLLKAIQLKINTNEIPLAEYYLKYMIPEELEKPEFYYMFSAIVLKERGKLDEAFAKLDKYKEHVEDIDSPYHQFYSGFNMTNGRIEEAVKYMVKYHEKNPNPTWFKTIQHSENETGGDLIKKIEELVGGREDLSEINYFFNAGVIGISVYEKLTGKRIEEMILDPRYPFTKLHICKGDVKSATKAVEKLEGKVLVDVATLNILAEAEGLHLLSYFDEVLICYESIAMLKHKETDLIRNKAGEILKFITESLFVKELPIDIGIKIEGRVTSILPQDTLDCIALSNKMGIPFLNSEISVYREFDSTFMIDINVLFFYFKNKRYELLDEYAIIKKKLRKLKFEFISFDRDDILSVYKQEGFEGIKPFIRMDKNSDYNSFLRVYISSLISINKIATKEEFETIASCFIQYFDEYLGKIRYYLVNLSRNYSTLRSEIEKVIENCNFSMLFNLLRKAHLAKYQSDLYFRLVNQNHEDLLEYHQFITKADVDNNMIEYRIKSYKLLQGLEYGDAIDSNDFMKVQQIMSVVAQFMIQYLSAFGATEDAFKQSKTLIERNLKFNTIEDINRLVKLFEEFKRDHDMENVENL